MSFIADVIIAMLLAMSGASAEEPAQRSSIVAIVGDSITWEHQDHIHDELAACGLPPVVIDAKPGRITTTSETPFGYIQSGVEAIEDIEETIDPSTWIIELGTNDVNTGRTTTDFWAHNVVDQVLDILDSTDTIYWVNTYVEVGRPEDSARFNRVLETYDRIQVLDWAEHAHMFLYDGIHPNQAGATHMADIYCNNLKGK